MTISRRDLMTAAALKPADLGYANLARAAEKVDHTIRIAKGLVELAPDQIVSTTLYNGQFPGPLQRFQEGKPVTVDVFNDTDIPELLHWHGQQIPSDVDGAAEEGTPFIPPHGMRRISFTPRPAGLRFNHTHVVAGDDLNRGTYTGQVGPLYIEPRSNPGTHDREIFLTFKEFAPTFSKGGDMASDALTGEMLPALKAIGAKADADAKAKTKGYEVGYTLFSINGRMLGHERALAGEARQKSVVLAFGAERQCHRDPQPCPAGTSLPGGGVGWCNPVPVRDRGAGALAGHRRACLGHCRNEPSRYFCSGRSFRRRSRPRHGNGSGICGCRGQATMGEAQTLPLGLCLVRARAVQPTQA